MSLHHLPAEMLRLIMSFLGGTLATNRIPSKSSIHAIALVCRNWRDIALCTPELWTEFVITFPVKDLTSYKEILAYTFNGDLEKHSERFLENLPDWLHRSNQLPLNIVVTNNGPDSMAPNREDFSRMWEVLLLAAPRWKSLQFQGELTLCSTFVERCNEAVALESLSIRYRSGSQGNTRILSPSVPRLKHLTLEGPSERFPSLVCPLLETVDVSFYHIKLFHIREFVSECPRITDLTLRSMNVDPEMRPTDTPDFPNLKSCQMSGNHEHIIDLLKAAPMLTTLTLELRSFVPQANARTHSVTHLNLHIEIEKSFAPPLGDTLASFPQLSHLSVRPSARLRERPIVKDLIEKLSSHVVNADFNLRALTLNSAIVPPGTLLRFSAEAKTCNISLTNCDPIPDFNLMKFSDLRGLFARDAGFLDWDEVVEYDDELNNQQPGPALHTNRINRVDFVVDLE